MREYLSATWLINGSNHAPKQSEGMSDEHEELTKIGWPLNPLNRHKFSGAKARETWRVSELAVLFPL